MGSHLGNDHVVLCWSHRVTEANPPAIHVGHMNTISGSCAMCGASTRQVIYPPYPEMSAVIIEIWACDLCLKHDPNNYAAWLALHTVLRGIMDFE